MLFVQHSVLYTDSLDLRGSFLNFRGIFEFTYGGVIFARSDRDTADCSSGLVRLTTDFPIEQWLKLASD